MGFIHAFGGSVTELLCGGRHNLYLDRMERLCRRLTENGARLAFFCDGQLTTSRINEWCRRKNDEYDKCSNVLNEIDRGVPMAHLRTRIHQNTCKKFAGSLLLVAERYGQVIISTDFSCDAAVAQYAVRHNALAVVATDSDNFIFEGKWQYWHATSLDFDLLRIDRFGRQELIDHLRLNKNEMRLFASILGNDYIKPGFAIDFGVSCRLRVPNIRDYVAMQQTPFQMNQMFIERVCKDLYQQNYAKFVPMMQESVNSYSIDFDIPPGETAVDRYAVRNMLMSTILYNGILQYEQNFVDSTVENNNNGGKTFTYALLPVIRRLAGILLQQRAINEIPAPLFKMVIYRKRYELEGVMPIYPDGEWRQHIKQHHYYFIQNIIIPDRFEIFLFTDNLPPLEEFLFGTTDYERYLKWKQFIWTLALPDITPDTIIQMPTKLLIPTITLLYMVQEMQISVEEADMLLVTEFDVAKEIYHPGDIKEPSILNGRAVRVAQLYNRFTTLIEDCLFVCGLDQYIVSTSRRFQLNHPFDIIFHDFDFVIIYRPILHSTDTISMH